jgi:NitT/TauT family transport system substrate-binding protein
MEHLSSDTSPRWHRARLTGLIAVLALVLTACGQSSAGTEGSTGTPTDGEAETPSVPLRLGYFPNVTHAPAIVGIEEGLFAERLGGGVELTTQAFNSGTEAVEAIFSGGLDMTYIGPNPAINGFAQSNGEAVRLISGSTSGGAYLVVRPGLGSAEDLRGTTLSSPSLGNTQDVALRAWLADNGLETDLEGGGDVSITPLDNAEILEGFRAGQLDGAWVPEPWATRMIDEADGVVLVDEADLWPGGQYVTTHILVATEFLEQQPDVVQRFLEAHVAAVDACNEDPEGSQAVVIGAIDTLTGSRPSEETTARAWKNLGFTVDPIASSLYGSAEDAVEVGLLEPVELDGIYDLTLLNEVLATLGRQEVTA